ncbi:hypothetical protein AIOL_001179 [Candidatus Rhodobacter oscarellae]|uniref:Mth938-like domain-containing protein n=1 Tax=Candidatus Rhodobacter oscarellae TaxID=1675527 RepID=A0A0J9E0P7_9RHOB|nr:hypothetical protein AIOL_001179 [Candidatus Rhodobacter lobularis]
MNEVTYTDATPIDGYGPGFFRVGGQVVQGSTLVLPSRAVSWGGYDDLEAVLACAGEIDVLLVGTGAEISHAPAAFRAAVEGAGIGLEVMASPPACRTYNVLLGEGRRIGAALLTV